MDHHLTIYHNRGFRAMEDGVIRTLRGPIRSRLLDWLLGKERYVTIIIPNDSVKSVNVREVASDDGGRAHDRDT
jgi:hypothetical protein